VLLVHRVNIIVGEVCACFVFIMYLSLCVLVFFVYVFVRYVIFHYLVCLFVQWAEFMKLGVNVPDSAVDERIRMLAPNQCCSLIFTVSFLNIICSAVTFNVYFCLI